MSKAEEKVCISMTENEFEIYERSVKLRLKSPNDVNDEIGKCTALLARIKKMEEEPDRRRFGRDHHMHRYVALECDEWKTMYRVILGFRNDFCEKKDFRNSAVVHAFWYRLVMEKHRGPRVWKNYESVVAKNFEERMEASKNEYGK